MIERPDADALMAGGLSQWLSSQNDERVRIKAQARRYRWYAVAAGIAVTAGMLLITNGESDWAFELGFAVGAMGFGYAEIIKRPLLDRLKGGINGAIAKALGLDYAVKVKPGKPFDRAKLFEMVPSYDDSHFQDLWWGVLAGQPFTLHEAKLTEQRGSGKDRRTETVFEGSILSIGFNRRFTSTTLVEPDRERRKFLIGAEQEQVTIGEVALARVDVVHPGFEERFTVWSNDQVEARYLIHPEYVERLLAVEAAFAGKDIRALFHEGDLLITLQTGDMFESGSLDADDDRMLIEQAIVQFGSLADLAATLNERARLTMSDLPGAS